MDRKGEEICVNCGGRAVYREDIYLDWGMRNGTVEVYAAAACSGCKHTVRDEVVKLFPRRNALDGNRLKANPFVGGCIIHVVPLGDGKRRVMIWSDIKDRLGWTYAHDIWRRVIGKRPRQKELFQEKIFGNPTVVTIADWRGWNAQGRFGKYDIPTVETTGYGRPYVTAFIRRWVKDLPSQWEPQFIPGLPLKGFPSGRKEVTVEN